MRTADVISRTGNTEQIEANLKNTFQTKLNYFVLSARANFYTNQFLKKIYFSKNKSVI